MVISHIFFYWNAPRTPFIHFSERSGTLWNIHSLNKSFAELKLPSKLQQTGHYAVLGVQFSVSIRHATRMLSTLIFSVDTCGVCLTKLTLCLVSHKGEGLIWASIPDSKSAIRWWWHVMGTFSAFLALTGELWGVFSEDFGENLSRYNGTALYYGLLGRHVTSSHSSNYVG